jgi:hypothetical protein
MGHKFNSKAIYERQDDTPGSSIIKASLIDMVSLKHETGVVGFFWAFTHCMMGPIIADEASIQGQLVPGKWPCLRKH